MVLLVALGAGLSQDGRFKSGIERVVIDAVVTDSHSRPVTDLTLRDFVVLDNGQPQRIVSCELVNAAQDDSPGHALARRSIAVLIDDYHLPLNHVSRVRDGVLAFITSAVPSDARLDVYLAGESADDNVPATRQSALDRVTALRSWSVSAAPHRSGEDALRAPANSADPGIRARNRALLVIYSLQSIVDASARDDNRNVNVFLVSAGFSIVYDKGETLLGPLTRLVSLASTRNVPIYSIHTLGLRPPAALPRLGPGTPPTLRGRGVGPDDSGDLVLQPLNMMASDTGGLLLANRNDVGDALRVAYAHRQRYYVLTYDIARDEAPVLHKVSVRIPSRRVSVKAKRGYVGGGALP